MYNVKVLLSVITGLRNSRAGRGPTGWEVDPAGWTIPQPRLPTGTTYTGIPWRESDCLYLRAIIVIIRRKGGFNIVIIRRVTGVNVVSF